jgi:triosephosphate isomerase
MRILLGNWKMHGCQKSILSFLEELSPAPQGIKAVLCFPFPYLAEAAKHLPRGYALGAQHCSAHQEGPFTGQVSASMLRDVGCTFSLVGHCERERFEDDSVVRAQGEQVLKAGMTPILCFKILDSVVDRMPLEGAESVLLAYEPVVGGDAPSRHVMDDMQCISKRFSNALLYGGGINASTLSPLLTQCDGFLVGRASLKVSSWNALLDACTTAAL